MGSNNGSATLAGTNASVTLAAAPRAEARATVDAKESFCRPQARWLIAAGDTM